MLNCGAKGECQEADGDNDAFCTYKERPVCEGQSLSTA